MSKRLFITGTGTDVGKTYIAGLLARDLARLGVRVAYFKCATSGCARDIAGRLESIDAQAVIRFAGLPQSIESAVSPHLAARWEGTRIDLDVATRALEALEREFDYVVVEGSGGILCPLRFDADAQILILDVMREWKTPALVVARSGLGSINELALTTRELARAGVPIQGAVFNRYVAKDEFCEDTAETGAALGGVRIVARVPDDGETLGLDRESLLALFD